MIIKKIKQWISKAKNKDYKNNIYSTLIYKNNHIQIVSDACAECYNVNKDKTYEQRLEYIRKRVSTGHESIIEHSNIVIYSKISKNNFYDITELLSVCRFLNTRTYQDDEFVYILIGGSLRGYKHLFRNINNLSNKVLLSIKEQLYQVESCYFNDFIEDGIMDKNKFIDVDSTYSKSSAFNNNKLDIVNVDDIELIINKLKNEKSYGYNKFEYNDLLDMCTITFHIKEVARIISQQLTRHRCAITQLSQRYVDYGKGFPFLPPYEFKPEEYDKDFKYLIEIFSNKIHLTQDELGQAIISIYPQLVNQGLLKEDARAYLPNNVSTSLFMTKTFRQWLHFRKERTSNAAQAEIRNIATIEDRALQSIDKHTFSKEAEIFLEPRYKLNEDKKYTIQEDEEVYYDDVDEIIEYVIESEDKENE